MGQHFVACDREQSFLMPPDVREWLPEDHLAWFVIHAVGEMNLATFYAAYRRDGRGRPAYDPAMMVALLLYAYARGIRSSRLIERCCEEDVAFRVLAAQQRPDHATIAQFIERHQDALAGLFGEVLSLCARYGLAKVGVIAVDGAKVPATPVAPPTATTSSSRARSSRRAKAVDAAEDELYGDARGDELPEQLRTGEGRRAWLREAKRRLEEQRAKEARPVPGDRPKRLKEAKRRLDEELWTEVRANQAYEHYRSGGMKDGRRFSRRPDPYTPPATPQGQINTTDLDSRLIKGPRGRGFLQGYNAQAVANEHQIVIAAEVMTAAPDFGHLEPMLDAAQRELKAAGVADEPGVLLGDAGYWHQEQMERIVNRGIQVLIPPDAKSRKGRGRAGTAGFTRSCAGFAEGAATLLSSHAEHPRPATSDTTKGGQAHRPTASKRVSSPPVGTIPTRRTSPTDRRNPNSKPHCDSDDRRARADREIVCGDVVPMHRMGRVGPSGRFRCRGTRQIRGVAGYRSRRGSAPSGSPREAGRLRGVP
jgi:transposase